MCMSRIRSCVRFVESSRRIRVEDWFVHLIRGIVSLFVVGD